MCGVNKSHSAPRDGQIPIRTTEYNPSPLSYLGLIWRSAVHVTSVPHMYNGDNLPPVIDFVDDAVMAHANPPTFTANQLAEVTWTGVVAATGNQSASAAAAPPPGSAYPCPRDTSPLQATNSLHMPTPDSQAGRSLDTLAVPSTQQHVVECAACYVSGTAVESNSLAKCSGELKSPSSPISVAPRAPDNSSYSSQTTRACFQMCWSACSRTWR